jgi:hypothetical protein
MIARPSTISFGETLIRGRDFPSQSVIVESDEPVEELIVNCDNQFATVNVSRRSECVFEVTITPVTTPPADFLDFPVLVLGRLKTGRANFPVKIRVTGRLIDDLQADPPVVVFSEVAKTRRAVVTVRTRTGRRLSDVSFNATDPSIHLAPLESSGNWASFEVALTDWPGNFRTSRVDFSALPPLGEQSLTASLRIVLQPTGK